MDNSLINQIADIEAIKKNLQAVVDLATKTAENLGKTFKNSVDLNFSDAEKGAKALENLTNTVKKGKQQLSDYSKAQENLAKAQANAGIASEKIAETIAMQAKSVAELTAKNKVLEAIKKNLNNTDSDYLSNIAKINEAQNANNQAIAETNNLEQKRTSGIGKYEEAIRNALGSTDNYKTQLLKLRNTMADLEIAIEAGGDSTGELAQQYDLLEQKAGQVADAQGDMQARIKYLADDYGKLKAVLSGVQAAMGMVAVVKGATELLGFHSEAVEKVTAKMTTLIATMQGLKQVQELLDKDNYFAQFIKQQERAGGAVGKFITALKSGMTSLKSFVGYASVIGAIYFGFTKSLKALSTTTYEYSKSLEELIIRQGEAIKASQEHTKTMQLQIETEIYQKVATGVMSLADAQEELEKAELKATEQNIKNTQTRIENLEAELLMQKAVLEVRKKTMETPSTLGLSGGGAAMAGAEAAAVRNAQKNIEATKQEIESTITSLGELKVKLEDMKKGLEKSTDSGKITKKIEVDTKEVFDFTKPKEEEVEMKVRLTPKIDENLLQVMTTEELEKVLRVWEDFNIGVEKKGKITFSIMENFAREITRKLYAGVEGITVEESQFIADKTLDLTKTIGNQLNTVLSDVLQNAIKIDEKEMKMQEEKVTRETENAKIVAKERIQDEQMLALELERIDILADQKKRKLLNEQAKRNFIAEQANFALQALVAFASAVAFTTGGIAVKLIAGGIAAAAVGAEALAHAAKGVPKYEEGGEAVANQPFIAGEAGAEIGIGKSGKLYNFDKEKLYMANENIKIFNHADSERLKPKLIENHTFTHDKAVNITVTRDYITDDRQQYVNKYLKIRK